MSTAEKANRRVFVYYFVYVDRPFRNVERELLDRFEELGAWASAAYRDGEDIRARLAVGKAPLLAKDVSLQVGDPIRAHAHTTIPLMWDATGSPGLFPRMLADLIIAPLGSMRAQLTFRGSYDPPLGPIGEVLDRALLHRVAEASVKAFMDRIALALGQTGASSPSEREILQS
ncbi:MAG: hypothetical protein OEX97_09225 [Acidimicrobiia bacterium]|nr:hypothetical protein [Acidimicrobiia bacterium]